MRRSSPTLEAGTARWKRADDFACIAPGQSPTPHPKLFRIRSRYRANLSDVPNAAMRLVGLALEQRREDLVDGLWQLVQDKEEAPALQNRVVGERMAVSQ